MGIKNLIAKSLHIQANRHARPAGLVLQHARIPYVQNFMEQHPGSLRADRRAQKSGLMMARIQKPLLREIEASGFQVLHQRIALTPLRKLWLAWKIQALVRF
jgi:hypothetical protein